MVVARFTAILALSQFVIWSGVNCQVIDPATSRRCNSATRCNECLIADPQCVWCADPRYSGSARCYANGDSRFLCSPDFVRNPRGSFREVTRPPLDGTHQVTPTMVEVSVRPGESVNFTLNIRPARNFPVDIYLLMDLSYSMIDDLANLQRLATELASTIRNSISHNFRVGFGSFVEKRVSPFVTLDTRYQNNPCLGFGECVATYSYRHHVQLTNDENYFNDQVQNQTISGNQDSPEGGFDGLLQAIVCKHLVGWRDMSRKLLLYITDAGFHIAGDGKLGGVVLPHDGLCKINETTAPQDYNDWLTLDYPSIGQIAHALRENDIIPIFAVQMSAIEAYRSLVRELGEGNAFVDVLDSDSGNIVNLIRDSYDNIAQRIVFDRQQVPEDVIVEIVPTVCPGQNVNGVCTGVQIENNATFDVRVTLQECNAQSNIARMVPIRVVGFDTFTISLVPICNCPCEDLVDTVPNSPACSFNGTLRCGRCDCNPGRFGDICQCDASGSVGGQRMECPRGVTDVECTSSERGTCVCGECQCRRNAQGVPLYFGTTCECDRDGCPSFNRELCSGRGVCTCDGCRCNVEPETQQLYFGDACECTPNTNCRDPTNSTDLCNGRGTCGCDGTCQCNFPYLGEFCELCSGDESCLELTCETNLPCAECVVNLLDQFPMTTDEMTFFSMETLASLPSGTTFTFDTQNSTYRFTLPNNYCPAKCLRQVVIISRANDVNSMLYNDASTTQCLLVGDCTHKYYVGIKSTANAVHVEYKPYSCKVNSSQFAGTTVATTTALPTESLERRNFTVLLGILAAVAAIAVFIFIIICLLFLKDICEVKRLDAKIAQLRKVTPLPLNSTQSEHKKPMARQDGGSRAEENNPLFSLSSKEDWSKREDAGMQRSAVDCWEVPSPGQTHPPITSHFPNPPKSSSYVNKCQPQGLTPSAIPSVENHSRSKRLSMSSGWDQ